MDKAPPQLIVTLGLFSGACLSAAWFSARPFDIVGAICAGAAACALVLVVLRFDRAIIKPARRATDKALAIPDLA